MDKKPYMSVGMALLLAFTFIGQVDAQSFPGSKMSIVVPVAPGGGTDLLGRLIAERLEKKWRNTRRCRE